MNPTHIHLMITHLPVFGSILGAIVLAFGIFRKNDDTKIGAYILFILSGIGAGIAYATGEETEEAVEHLPGVMESIINQHEDFAMYALISFVLLGILAIGAIIIHKKWSTLNQTVAATLLLLSLISFGLIAQTANLGGQIRHSEIRNGAIQNNSEGEDDDD